MIYHSRQVLQTTYCVLTEPMLISSFKLVSTSTSISRGSLENVTYKFVIASPVVYRTSCSSYLNGFRDGSYVAIQMLFRRVLLPGFVWYNLLHFCADVILTFSSLNKGFPSKVCVGFQVWYKTPEESQRTHRPKCCEYNNKDVDDSPNTQNEKNIYLKKRQVRSSIFTLFSFSFELIVGSIVIICT